MYKYIYEKKKKSSINTALFNKSGNPASGLDLTPVSQKALKADQPYS
jgi:hypothetical protein